MPSVASRSTVNAYRRCSSTPNAWPTGAVLESALTATVGPMSIRADRKSGTASAAMNTRMPSTETMMAIPPSVMTSTAARSMRLRRPIRLAAAAICDRTDCSGWAMAQKSETGRGTYGRRPVLNSWMCGGYFRIFASSAWACAADSGM